MKESKGGDHHIVEIHEAQIKITSSSSTQQPPEEIADSRGRLFLLKLWQREEEIVAIRGFRASYQKFSKLLVSFLAFMELFRLFFLLLHSREC